MREFDFEVAVCAGLERDGKLVARQLAGGIHGSRVIDTVVVEPGAEFDDRRRLTSETIPPRLLEADIGPGTAKRPQNTVGGSGYARGAIEAGIDCGYLTRERRGGQEYVRATTRYPDRWFDGLVGIENKPDLDRPGELELQLRKDVSLALFDEVWLATASHVTGAHLNRIPEEVGVWRVDPETGDRATIREATPLDPKRGGIEILEQYPGHTEIRPVGSEEKQQYRRRIAERAYGKGWRVPFPDCPHVEERAIAGVDGLAYCTNQARFVRPAEACESEGAGPEVDIDARRAEHSPWIRDPAGARDRQVGLDRYR
ncbi:DUF5787 family protein [Halosegnis longus]|uniref:DUF5787 family protein n=1 Tax=Halosegnis longus TaxID=2216012 RepID=UPI00129EEC03|nr:DUF5787 family protein [Halosegnis longus]